MTNYAKAIAAFVTPTLVSFLLPLGITAETSVGQAVEMLLLAGITAAAVYFVPNRQK